MKNTKRKNSSINEMIANLFIQLGCLFLYQYFAITWVLYIVIGLLSIVILVQTAGASLAFSSDNESIGNNKTDKKIHFLVAITYLASCYQLYLAGFTIFSVVAATHVAILILTLIMRTIIEK